MDIFIFMITVIVLGMWYNTRLAKLEARIDRMEEINDRNLPD
jgi:hypothetical protein